MEQEIFTSDSGVKYTNKHGLPQEVVNAIMKDRYTVAGEEVSDYSTSRLVMPIQQLVLYRRYPDELILRDVMHFYKSFLGSVIHSVLEEGWHVGIGSVVEQRLYIRIGKTKISGKFDCYHDGVINDYKSTGVYKIRKQDYLDWERSLNIYAEFCDQNNMPVKELKITYFCLDHKEHESWQKNYPPCAIGIIDIPLWPKEKRIAYIKQRIKDLIHARDLPEEQLAEEYPCSPRDMWQDTKDFAIMKKGAKKAVSGGVFSEEEEKEGLKLFNEKYKESGEYTYKRRRKRRKRCFDWCDISHKCHQHKMLCKAEGVESDKQEKVKRKSK